MILKNELNIKAVCYGWMPTDWAPSDSNHCDNCKEEIGGSNYSTAGLRRIDKNGQEDDWIIGYDLCQKCAKEFENEPQSFIEQLENKKKK